MIKPAGKKQEALKPSKWKRTILTIAIAIFLVLFLAYAIETIYPSPKYENFCKPDAKQYYTQPECEKNQGTWSPYPAPAKDTNISGYCDIYQKCNQEYMQVNDHYNRNLFFITLILGLIIVVASVFLKIESVSSGLMTGGVILAIYGTIRYWNVLSNIIRTIMLGLALAVLIWIGYKKLKD